MRVRIILVATDADLRQVTDCGRTRWTGGGTDTRSVSDPSYPPTGSQDTKGPPDSSGSMEERLDHQEEEVEGRELRREEVVVPAQGVGDLPRDLRD